LTRSKRSKATSPSDGPLVVNGWQIFVHPLLVAQLEKLIAAVERERGDIASANFKLLALLHRAMFEDIPEDPTRETYRQGGTLGKDRKHWFRAKLGGRFRLFFRYSSTAKIIIFAWVNDTKTLRQYGARTDAYAVFASMLSKGSPPADWAALMAECAPSQARQAFAGLSRSARSDEPPL
jgi:toxin YhaV